MLVISKEAYNKAKELNIDLDKKIKEGTLRIVDKIQIVGIGGKRICQKKDLRSK